MSLDIRPFQIPFASQWGILCGESRRVTGLYCPTFAEESQASLFASWAAEYRQTHPYWPSVDEQERAADAVRRYLDPIVGIDVRDVLSDEEIMRDFLASAPGRELWAAA